MFCLLLTATGSNIGGVLFLIFFVIPGALGGLRHCDGGLHVPPTFILEAPGPKSPPRRVVRGAAGGRRFCS